MTELYSAVVGMELGLEKADTPRKLRGDVEVLVSRGGVFIFPGANKGRVVSAEMEEGVVRCRTEGGGVVAGGFVVREDGGGEEGEESEEAEWVGE